MKKLMIAAAVAAMAAGAYAGASAASLDAQVYDVNLTVKSTTCKEVKMTKTIAYLEGIPSSYWNDYKNERVAVRKQASTKIAGVIWGCECETIARPAWRLYNNRRTIGGYLFWNVGGDTLFNIFSTRFGWAVLNRIDNGAKAEGVWQLSNWDANNTLAFLGAGFGKVSGTSCRTVLSNMSGNFAGFVLAGSGAAGCAFCGGSCVAWQLCPCLNGYYDLDLSAAYGTWKIKYNKSASVKLRKNGRITQSYNFKKAGNAAEIFAKVENAVAKGALAADDWDDWDDDYEYEYGEEIDVADVGEVAYATGDEPGEPPEAYEGDNILVEALLYGDAS